MWLRDELMMNLADSSFLIQFPEFCEIWVSKVVIQQHRVSSRAIFAIWWIPIRCTWHKFPKKKKSFLCASPFGRNFVLFFRFFLQYTWLHNFVCWSALICCLSSIILRIYTFICRILLLLLYSILPLREYTAVFSTWAIHKNIPTLCIKKCYSLYRCTWSYKCWKMYDEYIYHIGRCCCFIFLRFLLCRFVVWSNSIQLICTRP